jgi:hypothetical protein
MDSIHSDIDDHRRLASSQIWTTRETHSQFCDRKRGERLIHTQALLALARRLVDVLWALLRDGPRVHPRRADHSDRCGLT